ncbi:extracellular solute-binding protein [Cohnella sp. REN36]|uniref:extracellular solute-binding protein n=1 Tax=Cohnella sp. REN36 TaxID=2887347 RepID=UPI001D157A05|nr:extracellular solute-binding protein [Cohnella sp. REN36]MCC3375722.1 extracellular solute-binding protein [Cohnella sp. REN36]
MRKTKRALLGTFAGMFVLATALAGCAGKDKGANGAASPAASPNSEASASPSASASDAFELGKEPLTISLYGHYDWYAAPPWGEDEVSKWIKENKKLNINFIQSGGDAKKKLSTMMATKELPDIIWMDRGSAEYEMLRQADMLVPFDDYMKKYPNLQTYLSPETANLLRAEDGKLYQFPNWYTNKDKPNGNAGYVINKKIYEELGSPKLETTDDLYEYLKAVNAKYGNGITPFEPELAVDGQGLDVLYSAFGENALNRWVGNRAVPSGDKMASIFKDPVYRESMQFASKLFREKLMTQDAMTQTRDQVTEKVNNGKVAVYASSSPTDIAAKAQELLVAKDPNAGYFMIWPIAKPGLDRNKIYPGTYATLGWNVAVITKSAKNPEAAFAVLDWMTGPEGMTVLNWGPEGKYWEGHEADGITPKFKDAYWQDPKGLAELQAVTNNLIFVGNTVFTDLTKGKFESTLKDEQRSWTLKWQYDITWKTQADATEYANLSPAKDSQEGIIQTAVEDIWDESRAQALFAKSDEEVLKILDKADQDAMAVGYQKLLDYQTERWHRNQKIMKGE